MNLLLVSSFKLIFCFSGIAAEFHSVAVIVNSLRASPNQMKQNLNRKPAKSTEKMCVALKLNTLCMEYIQIQY